MFLKTVFSSPECVVDNIETFAGLIQAKKLLGVAVDEAHLVYEWGMGENPFRIRYSQLHLLKNKLPSIPWMILTGSITAKTLGCVEDSLELRSGWISRFGGCLVRVNVKFEFRFISGILDDLFCNDLIRRAEFLKLHSTDITAKEHSLVQCNANLSQARADLRRAKRVADKSELGEKISRIEKQIRELEKIISDKISTALVFVDTSYIEIVKRSCTSNTNEPVTHYHSALGLDAENQGLNGRVEFVNGMNSLRWRIAVVTTAVEMGVDIRNVGYVVCMNSLHTLTSILQRGGRLDREGGTGVLLQYLKAKEAPEDREKLSPAQLERADVYDVVNADCIKRELMVKYHHPGMPVIPLAWTCGTCEGPGCLDSRPKTTITAPPMPLIHATAPNDHLQSEYIAIVKLADRTSLSATRGGNKKLSIRLQSIADARLTRLKLLYQWRWGKCDGTRGSPSNVYHVLPDKVLRRIAKYSPYFPAVTAELNNDLIVLCCFNSSYRAELIQLIRNNKNIFAGVKAELEKPKKKAKK
jgi:hypothetical protein